MCQIISKTTGAYEGKISSDGAFLAGMWTYNHASMLLELLRATQETAWHVPFQYQ
jgi:hypothetical protein